MENGYIMEEKIKEELMKNIIKCLESEKEDFESAVTFATNFSIDNSISSDSLLELSDSCGSSELYSLSYILARACSILSTENREKANAHHFAGYVSFLMRRNEEAEKEYKLALENDPRSVIVLYNYGNLLQKMGRNEEAETEYKLALETNPKHVGAHSNYGILLQDLGRKGEAEKEYKLALEANPKDANTHYNYGNLLQEMGREGEAEKEYKLALEANPNATDIHSNYGTLLSQMKRPDEAEKEYKIALKADLKSASTHTNYGNLLQEMGRYGEAEIEYKLALQTDPNYSFAHNNYGNLLQEMGRYGEVEIEYKRALETNPNDATVHYNYGRWLQKTGCNEEAEIECKLAIELNPKNPYYHASYSLILASKNLEKQAIEEAKTASRGFKENGDTTKEHLSVAWLYEDLANKYYDLKKYQDSGQYAEISGNEYIEASKYAKEITKDTLLTKGYTLKARAKIRNLEIKPSFYERKVKKYIQPKNYEIETLTKIMDCIADASRLYEKASEVSPEKDQICNACSTSMLCLSEILDCMMNVISNEEVSELEKEIETWEKKLIFCKEIYERKPKGKAFIYSLEKLIACIKNLGRYKKSRRWKDQRAFDECIRELSKVARNIEGPLQKIIEDSAKKMDMCRRKNKLYAYNQVYTIEQNRLFRMLNWISEVFKNYAKPITITVIGGLILFLVKQMLGLS